MRAGAIVLVAAIAAASCSKKRANPAATPPTTASAGSQSGAAAGAADASPPPTDDLAGWRADLARVGSELPRRHPAPFAQIPEDAFHASLAAVAAALPSLTRDQRVVGLARVIALIGDAHTQLVLDPHDRDRIYPVTFYWFTDGLVVTDAAEPYRWAIGLRLASVGDRSVDNAVVALARTVGYQAEGYRRAEVAWRLSWPTFLRGTDLAPADGPAHFGLVDATGATRDLALEPTAWHGTAPAPATLPLYRKRPQAFYWSTYLTDSRALYVQYNRCADAPDLTVAAFASAVAATLDSHPVDRLIIDLRWNSGGNSELIRPLLDAISARPTLNGRLFALISRHTFSSALLDAIYLDHLGAVLIGEPAGSPADHYGEVQLLALPATGLAVQHSTKHFAVAGYPGRALAPEILVELSSADYLAGKDPVLDAALAAPVPAPPSPP